MLLLVGTPRFVKVGYDKMTKTEQVENTPQARPAPPTGESVKPTFINSAKENLTTRFQGKLNYQFGLNGRGYVT